MPTIQEYNAPQGIGLQPTETGINATAQAARRIQGAYNEAATAQKETGRILGSAISDAGGVAVRYMEHQEVSRGAAKLAGDTAGLMQSWDDTVKKADPNDPTVATKFMAGLEPQLEKFKSAFLTEGGQKWAESRVDSLRNHFNQKTQADMARMASEAVVINEKERVNSLSAAVRIDPSYLGDALKDLEADHNGIVGSSNVSAEHMPHMMKHLEASREALVKSAAIGEIEKTGEVPKWVTDPKFSKYINTAELTQFARMARYYNKMEESAGKAAQAHQEHEAKLKFNTQINQLELATEDPDTGLPVVGRAHYDALNKIVQDNPTGAALEPGRVRQMKEGFDAIVRRMNKAEPPAADSHRVANGLIERIGKEGEGRLTDDSEIYANSERMTISDLKMVRTAFKQARTDEGRQLARTRNEFFKDHAINIDPSYGTSAEGMNKIFFAKQEALRQEEVLRKAGKDPNSIYDPRSPDYFGRPENLSRFKASLSDLMKGLNADTGVLKVNDVRDGWRYTGGDPSKPASWVKVQ